MTTPPHHHPDHHTPTPQGSNMQHLDHENIVTSDEVGNGSHAAATAEITTTDGGGYFLRWSRLTKRVEIRDIASGLVHSSIGANNINNDNNNSNQQNQSSSVMANASSANNNNISSKRSSLTSGPVTKVILNQVSGYAQPGQVVALMGPSGSGKTSLLNTLSGRSVYESGIISINGEPITSMSIMKRLMSRIAYVKQADVFFEALTVRDQLTYTALLRLPSTMASTMKYAEVKRILKLLRLENVADSPIGLLSGGEKKRVSIGTELLTDPKVLLCDEPISGLDSTTAFALLEILHKLAKEYGKTVITSIHQPSSPVFHSFDRLLMLAEGNVVYFGTPSESITYLRDRGLACPDGYNVADYWMDLLVHDTVQDIEGGPTLATSSSMIRSIKAATIAAPYSNGGMDKDDHGKETTNKTGGGSSNDINSAAAAIPPRQRLIATWDNEAVAEQMDAALVQSDNTTTTTTIHTATSDQSSSPSFAFLSSHSGSKYNTSWMTQFLVLTHRSLKNSRSAIFTPINMVKSLAIGLICGILWFQLDNTEGAVKDKSSYCFFTTSYWLIDSAFDSLMAFPSERDVILKERASASYHLSAYFLGKTTSEAPVRLSLPVLYMIISYWMAGVNPRFTIFLAMAGCTLLSVLAGDSLGLLVGASVYDVESSLAVLTVVVLSLMLLGGFFVAQTPSWISWAKYLSPIKYAFDALQILAFDRSVPCDGSDVLQKFCNQPGATSVAAQDVLSYVGVTGSIGFNVGLLIVVAIVPRYISYLALRSQKAGDRS